MKQHSILVYCDGAASGNPGPAGWGALLYMSDGAIRELGGSSPRATNNQMELTAAIEALKALRNSTGSITMATDSRYVISGATQWIHNWKRKGWTTMQGGEVLNRSYWEELDALLSSPRFDDQVLWEYVPGHSGVPGNERTDEIAVAFSKNTKVTLFEGNISSYRFTDEDLRNFSARQAAPAKRSKLPALHYLSFIDGVPKRHATWAECEARVKGKAQAKFKKVIAPGEEAQILAQWGAPSIKDK